MTTIAPTFIGIIIFLLGTEWLLPNFLRPDNLFGVTVAPDTRAQPAGRALIRNWRLVVSVVGLVAIGGILSALWLLPTMAAFFVQTGILLLVVAAELVQIAIFHQRAQAFAVPASGTVRATSLSPQPRGPLITLVVGSAATGPHRGDCCLLATQYANAPAIIPIHWDLDGHANGFATKSIGSFFQLVWTQIGLWVLLTAIIATLRMTRIGNNANASQRHHAGCPGTFHLCDQDGRHRHYGISSDHHHGECCAGSSPFPGLVAGPSLGLVLLALVGAMVIFVDGRVGERPRARHAQITGDGTPDSKWIWGIFYYNPNDPALFVERRIGLGTTVNFGHPASWLILGAIIIVPIAISVIAVVTQSAR